MKSVVNTMRALIKFCITLCLARLEGIVESESIVNLCDVQDSVEDASRQLAFFFPNFHKTKTDKVEKTLALIRPCILKERRSKH